MPGGERERVIRRELEENLVMRGREKSLDAETLFTRVFWTRLDDVGQAVALDHLDVPDDWRVMLDVVDERSVNEHVNERLGHRNLLNERGGA